METKPIRNAADHERALNEIEKLWGAAEGSRDGDRLEALITQVDTYEQKRYPMDPSRRRSGRAA